MPLHLPEADAKSLLETFRVPGAPASVRHVDFFNMLTAAELVRPADCTVPLFGVCYAMLLGITQSFDTFGENVGNVLAQKFTTEDVNGRYSEYIQLRYNLHIGPTYN